MELKDYHKALGLLSSMTSSEIIDELKERYGLFYDASKDRMLVHTFEGIVMLIPGDDLESKIDNACQFLVIDEYRRQMDNKKSFQNESDEERIKHCSYIGCEGGCNLCETWIKRFKITQKRYDWWNYLGWVEHEFIYDIVDSEEDEKLIN